MGFVPVKFYSPHLTILEQDVGNTFPLAPTPFPKLFLQSRQIANSAADSDGLNFRNFTDQLKYHSIPYCQS